MTGSDDPQRTDADATAAEGDGTEVAVTDGGYGTEWAAPGATVGGGGRLRTVTQLRTLAGTEIRLGVRGRWVPILAATFAAFGLLIATFGGSAPGPDGYVPLVASIASLAVYLVPLAGLVYAYDALAGAERRGWLDAVTALPVRPSVVVGGIAIGRAVVIASAVLVGFAVPGLVLLAEFGVGGWAAYAGFLVVAAAAAVAFASIGIAISVVAPSKTIALGAAMVAWVWFVLLHDLLALGVIAAFDLSSTAVAASVLSNPATIFRVLVLDWLGAGGQGFASVLAASGLTTTMLVAGLLAWIVLPVLGVVLALRARSLVGR